MYSAGLPRVFSGIRTKIPFIHSACAAEQGAGKFSVNLPCTCIHLYFQPRLCHHPRMNIFVDIPEPQLRKERDAARKLRKSQWWQNRIAKGHCYYCNAKVAPKELTLDHIVPLVRGGRSSKGNCVPACKECNSKKQDLLPTEWDSYLESLSTTDPDSDT